MTMAQTFAQAISLANTRARRTGTRQRVTVCGCPSRHFMVWPVDRVPAGAL